MYAGFKIFFPAMSLAKGQPPLKELWGETVPYSTCFSFEKKVDILQKLDPLSFTFGLVTHLTHHVLKLTHSLAFFEGAAIVERRACGTDAFLFLSKLGIWAATTEKCQYSCEVSKKTIYLKHLQNHAYKATENCVCGQTERVLRVIYFLSPQRFHHFCGVSHEITA